jgi:hypothetical protein
MLDLEVCFICRTLSLGVHAVLGLGEGICGPTACLEKLDSLGHAFVLAENQSTEVTKLRSTSSFV